MEINDKKLKRTTKVINWLIAIVLCVFLILLSNKIISDLDTSITAPSFDEFVDKSSSDKLKEKEDDVEQRLKILNEKVLNVRKMINVAQKNKNDEQQSFDNWIQTRGTLGNSNQDKEVLQRVHKLDDLTKIEQSWQYKEDSLRRESSFLYEDLDKINADLGELNKQARIAFNKVQDTYDLKVFFIRLLFVVPILVLGIFFFMRFRNSKFAPLFLGFSLFSLYAFFFGLVPYLPSYGGYIRYTVGILLTIWLGYYAIKKLTAYSKRKKAELEASGIERAEKLADEVVEKSFNNHVCPSCGKDFLLKNWDATIAVDVKSVQPMTNFCRYCGLQLMKTCETCNHLNYAHLTYCVKCGSKIK